MKLPILLPLLLIISSFGFSQTTYFTTYIASEDVTLYEDTAGNLSNGQGVDLQCGVNNIGKKRRTLVKFRLQGIPQNATITSAFISLEIAQSNPTSKLLSCHRVLADWGEGLSNAGFQSDSGTTPLAGDATWIHSFYPNNYWNNPGGDYETIPTDTVSTGSSPFALFQSPKLINDVQLYYDSSNLNFGWMIIGDETSNGSAFPFYSKDFQPGLEPRLNVGYITTTELTDLEKSNAFSISPNPASDYISIGGLNDFVNKPDFAILDYSGRTIKSGKLTSNRLMVKDLSNGSYILRIHSLGQTTKLVKFVKN